MSGALILLKIAGFVALLLWGTHMVTSGILRGFGGDLRQRIGSAMSSTPRAFVSGITVTLALQSSTATGLMASSFAANGVLAAVPGFVLMLGANVGTALVTQVFAFSAVALSGPLFLVGYALFRNSRSTRWRNLGRASIGIGLVFLSLHELVSTFQPLSQIAVIRQLLEALGSQTLLALLLGVAAAWLCHSSVAVVLLVLSLAASGILPLAAGLAMVLGANLGGAIPPVLEVHGAVARRLPLGNLLVRAVGVSAAILGLPSVLTLLQHIGHTQPRALVDAHVVFNVVLALLALPFARQASALLVRMLPDPPVQEDPGQPRYLDDALVNQPHLALTNIEREALRLSDTVADQMRHARRALVTHDPDAVAACGRLGDAATSLGPFLRRHLSKIPSESMSEEEKQRVHEFMAFVINIEHVADLIPHNLVEPVSKRAQRGELLGPEATAMVDAVMGELVDGLGLAITALLRRDLRAAKALVVQKAALRNREQAWALEHGSDANPWQGTSGSAVEMDVVVKALRECRRIYGHLGAIGYQLLEGAGQLQSRLADGEGS